MAGSPEHCWPMTTWRSLRRGFCNQKSRRSPASVPGTFHFTSIELSDRKIRLYGTTALVTSRAEVTGTSPDGDVSGSYRYTRVYVKDVRGVWHIVSFEASKIREPGAQH